MLAFLPIFFYFFPDRQNPTVIASQTELQEKAKVMNSLPDIKCKKNRIIFIY